MNCIFCNNQWDGSALISAKIDLTTADEIPRSFSLTNQPICSSCISEMSKIVANNAREAELSRAKGD